MKQLLKKNWLAGLLALVLALTVTACGGTQTPQSPQPAEQETAQPAEQTDPAEETQAPEEPPESQESGEAALPEDTARHLYRVILTGETGEAGAGAEALQEALADRFYALEVRDRTRMAEDIWRRAEEDSLRGAFLRELRRRWEEAKTEEERETVTRAVRFGLAALDHRDLG